MSLLADPDYLLHSFRLNYIRHVLPNHSAISSLPGTGPHNLISFDPTSPTLSSPYVVSAGLTDETQWPELTSGRSSPPLGLAFGRGDSSGSVGGGAGRRRGAGGATGLNYTQTIVGKGSGTTGPGMRVAGGRHRSWKGRGAGAAAGETGAAEDTGAAEGIAEVQEATTENLRRRNSLETTIHRRRMMDNANSSQLPPPVVIHSPVRTPVESPSTSASPNPSLPDPSQPPTPESPANDQLTAEAAEEAAEEEDRLAYDSAPTPEPTSEPLSHISENSELAGSPAPLVHSFTSSSPSPVQVSSSFRSSDSLSSSARDVVEPSSPYGARFASVASSGVSLFGVSRLNSSSEGAIMSRERSDSESSSLALPASDRQTTDEDDEVELMPPPPPTPPLALKPNFRTRERRRVNISGRMLVPISEPANEEDTPPHSAAPGPHPSAGLSDSHGRPRSNTDPSSHPNAAATTGEPTTSATTEPAPAVGAEPPLLRRKSSAPSLLPTLIDQADVASTSPASSQRTPSKRGAHPPRHQPTITFAKRPVARLPPPSTTTPLPTARSALTALLTSQSDTPGSSNPFSTLYGALSSRGTDALKLTLYFPGSKTPSKKLKIGVKKDLTVEEVIGCGLWAYFEEEWEPKLEVDEEEGKEGQETTKWNLRIVEDDGEVDEDFPALDRSRAISAFSFDEFAIVKATGPQIKDNQTKQSSIVRRPSRVLAAPKRNFAAAQPPRINTALAPPVSAIAPGAGPISPHSATSPFGPGTATGASSALAIGVLLRVRLPPAPGVETIATTINVPNDMYMSDVLDHICKKRGLDNPKDWVLMVRHNNADIVVPLDRTVDSLGDRHDLTLVQRSQVASLRGANRGKTMDLKNTNPSASIFKRLSEPPQPKYQTAADIASTYQRYNVQRKLPVPLGRHPRTIAIDGDYIHFMPSDTKSMFEAGRTTSYHISTLIECKLSRRAPTSFKILVQKHRTEKRYDFEAETPKQAQEIVAHVKALMATFAREDAARQGGL